MNDKLLIQEIDGILELIKAPTFLAIHNINYLHETDSFVGFETEIPQDSDEELPTIDDLAFCHEFFKNDAKEYFESLGSDGEFDYSDLERFFQSILQPRRVYIMPIIRYLVLKEVLVYISKDRIIFA